MREPAQCRTEESALGCIVAVLAVGLASGLCVTGILVAFVLPKIRASRAAAQRPPDPTTENLHQIAIALHNYHDTFGTFPPAYIADPSGKPLYSGRVLLLPYLGERALFDQFDKDQAWDSPQNQPLSQSSVGAFTNPKTFNSRPGQTDFLFVVGNNTIFEAGKRIAMADIVDGAPNTMVIVEVKASGISWAEPSDVDLSQPALLPPGYDARGNFVSFGDGSVRLLPKTFTPQQVRDLATRDGGEPNNRLLNARR